MASSRARFNIAIHTRGKGKAPQDMTKKHPFCISKSTCSWRVLVRMKRCARYTFSGFTTELEGGHGSHTAGTAAGVMLDSPAELDCGDGEELGCLGGCFDSTVLDDLAADGDLDFETFCPAHDCDGLGEDQLSCFDDAMETLAANSGVAPGAQIAVFDVGSDDEEFIWAFFAGGNGLWDAAEDTGSKVHSNSWGTSTLDCETDTFSTEYDRYMHEVK